jgi:hypothetical protein
MNYLVSSQTVSPEHSQDSGREISAKRHYTAVSCIDSVSSRSYSERLSEEEVPWIESSVPSSPAPSTHSTPLQMMSWLDTVAETAIKSHAKKLYNQSNQSANHHGDFVSNSTLVVTTPSYTIDLAQPTYRPAWLPPPTAAVFRPRYPPQPLVSAVSGTWDISWIPSWDPLMRPYHWQSLQAWTAQLEALPRVPIQEYRELQWRFQSTMHAILTDYHTSYCNNSNFDANMILVTSIDNKDCSSSSSNNPTEIISNNSSSGDKNDGEMRVLLNTLYDETIRALQQLVVDNGGVDSTTAEVAVMSSGDSIATMDSDMASDAPFFASSAVIPKRDFGHYMTLWLRDNWINPYPDEEGLVQLARDCGTTPTVVANWLINARTRKWRPAMMQASHCVERPARMLWEDSLAIFEGRSVQRLDTSDGQSSSTPGKKQRLK